MNFTELVVIDVSYSYIVFLLQFTKQRPLSTNYVLYFHMAVMLLLLVIILFIIDVQLCAVRFIESIFVLMTYMYECKKSEILAVVQNLRQETHTCMCHLNKHKTRILIWTYSNRFFKILNDFIVYNYKCVSITPPIIFELTW